jgi:hypothetical protein
MDMGHLIGIFKGRLSEDDVVEKISSMGMFQGEVSVKVWPCSRDGVDFEAKVLEPRKPRKPKGQPLIFTPAKKEKT